MSTEARDEIEREGQDTQDVAPSAPEVVEVNQEEPMAIAVVEKEEVNVPGLHSHSITNFFLNCGIFSLFVCCHL